MDSFQTITNGNCYLDGTNNLVGKLTEATLPEIALLFTDVKALGMFGTLEMPVGLDKLTAKVKWGGFYAEHLKGANPFDHRKLQVRSSVERRGPSGVQARFPMVTHLTVYWKKVPLGVIAPQTNVEFEEELGVIYVKQVIDGDEAHRLEIDVMNNIYIVDGKDLLAEWRQHLGV